MAEAGNVHSSATPVIPCAAIRAKMMMRMMRMPARRYQPGQAEEPATALKSLASDCCTAGGTRS